MFKYLKRYNCVTAALWFVIVLPNVQNLIVPILLHCPQMAEIILWQQDDWTDNSIQDHQSVN